LRGIEGHWLTNLIILLLVLTGLNTMAEIIARQSRHTNPAFHHPLISPAHRRRKAVI
jgi:hypothetical protein